MKTFRKTLSLLLAVIMLLGSVPLVSGGADTQIDGEWWYNVSDGKATLVFFNVTVTGAVTIPSYLGGYKVTAIDDGAFNNRKDITSVTIPDTVVTIGNEAFKGCSLESVKIGKNVTSIGEKAFHSCTSLKSVTIPDSVTSIGKDAFTNCTSLTETYIGKGLSAVNQGFFKNCRSLKTVTVSNGITTVDSEAFYGCTSLSVVTLPDSVTTIGGYAFKNCKNLRIINLGENLASIGYSAFNNCESLTDVYFSGSTKDWKSVTVSNGNTELTEANLHILGDPIIPIIPEDPDEPSDPDTPDNPGSSDGDVSECSCKCHMKGFKKFIFRITLFFQKILRRNKICSCGALHY